MQAVRLRLLRLALFLARWGNLSFSPRKLPIAYTHLPSLVTVLVQTFYNVNSPQTLLSEAGFSLQQAQTCHFSSRSSLTWQKKGQYCIKQFRCDWTMRCDNNSISKLDTLQAARPDTWYPASLSLWGASAKRDEGAELVSAARRVIAGLWTLIQDALHALQDDREAGIGFLGFIFTTIRKVPMRPPSWKRL